jgi:hypothetical protein
MNTAVGIARWPSLTLNPAVWIPATFAVFWVSLLGHEAAHFGMAQLLYSQNDLAAGSVSPRAQVFVVGAGPTLTLLVLIGCAAYAWRSPHRHSLWIPYALAYSAASRLAFVAPGTLLGTAVNDERTVGRLIDVSPRLLWSLEALIATIALFIVSTRWPAASRRSLSWMMVGIAMGWASALTLGRAAGLPV